MNIKKKNFIIYSVILFAVACLFSCGIFAVVTKSVSFNLALKVEPKVFFSMVIQVSNDDGGSWSNSKEIFNNKTGADVVNWATVNQNTIVLNQVLADNDLPEISTGSKLKLTVTNLTEKSADNAEEYLHLTLNYLAGQTQTFTMDNGYGIVNMEYGESSATQEMIITASNILADTYILIPFLAEIDAFRYSASITTINCNVVNAKKSFTMGENYIATFFSYNEINASYVFKIQTNNNVQYINSNDGILQLSSDLYSSNLEIVAIADSNEVWNGSIATEFAYGDGTEENPFLICNPKQLALVAHVVNNANGAKTYSGNATLNSKTTYVEETAAVNFGSAYYKICNDLVMNSGYENYQNWSSSTTGLNNWTAIGTSSIAFAGNFDGGNHEINGFFLNYPDSTYQGLFANSSGVIENVTLKSGFITGLYYVAGICVYSNNTISNCHNYCNISTTGNTGGSDVGSYTAGITSYSYSTSSSIIYCSNKGNIFAPGDEGAGICGISGGKINSCANFGNVSAYHAGGIVGSRGNITNCFNMGTITALEEHPRCLGGIQATNSNSSYTLLNNYNKGLLIHNNASGCGGIVGMDTYQRNTILFCYSTPETVIDTGSNGNATIDASTKLLSTNVTVGSYTGNNLLDALNAYVEANPGNGYLNWVEGPDGWPVFGTIKN